MKIKFILGILLLIFSIVETIAYTPPPYDNINLVLNGTYTPPSYGNINLVLGEELIPTNAPIIFKVNPISATDPIEGGIRIITVNFTAMDNDGVANLNDATANITFIKAGEQTRGGSCTENDINSTTTEYNCSIDIYYYDGSSSWTVNASVIDLDNLIGVNDTTSFNYNELKAMIMTPTAINFGTGLTAGTNDVAATDDPIVLNNTGNFDFTEINITAYDLIGQSDSSKTIPAENIRVNKEDLSGGDILINSTAVVITDVELPRNSINYTYYYANLPNIYGQEYSTTVDLKWLLELF